MLSQPTINDLFVRIQLSLTELSKAFLDGNGRFNAGTFKSDNIVGSNFSDVLFGGLGNDVIASKRKSDFVYGGAGKDTIDGGAGEDFVFGGLGSDIIDGGADNDLLIASSGNDTLLGGGIGEVDTMVGGLGADKFVLGDAQGAYYDDGDASRQGLNDYAVIADFKSNGTDKIQLSGGATRYILETTGSGLPSGVAIYEIAEPFRPTEPIFSVGSSSRTISPPFSLGNGGDSGIAPKELIGIVENTNISSLSLNNSAQFTFV